MLGLDANAITRSQCAIRGGECIETEKAFSRGTDKYAKTVNRNMTIAAISPPQTDLIDFAPEYGQRYTGLHYAAKAGDSDLVQYLIARGTNINRQTVIAQSLICIGLRLAGTRRCISPRCTSTAISSKSCDINSVIEHTSSSPLALHV